MEQLATKANIFTFISIPCGIMTLEKPLEWRFSKSRLIGLF
jgi:hypothetical protein|tara:strand:+ start:2314 stop:2436 length:123 start_codon:yes stop_codon:yes gene_type:complete